MIARLAYSAFGAALLIWAGAAAADEGGNGGLVISTLPAEPLQPLTMNEVIEASQPTAAPDQPTPDQPAPDRIAAALPAPDAPRRAGLPEPSIILGDLAVLMTTAERGPLGTPRPAREAIRQRDPAMFQRLLTQGAFDPDEAQVTAAVQTELGQMGCYGGGIDGSWGAGSASALARYFQALGSAEAATAPDLSLFRTIAGNEAVTCPEVRVAAPTTRTPATQASRNPSRGGGGGQAAAANTAPRQEPSAAQPASGPPRINPGLMGSGMFR